MEDPNENWLVRLYYNNTFFFVIMACGADNGLVLAFVYNRYPYMQQSLSWTILLYVAVGIIALK